MDIEKPTTNYKNQIMSFGQSTKKNTMDFT